MPARRWKVLWARRMDPVTATAYSLFIVGVTSLMGLSTITGFIGAGGGFLTDISLVADILLGHE